MGAFGHQAIVASTAGSNVIDVIVWPVSSNSNGRFLGLQIRRCLCMFTEGQTPKSETPPVKAFPAPEILQHGLCLT